MITRWNGVATLVVLLLASEVASPAEVPTGLQGVRWGTGLEDMKQAFPSARCDVRERELGFTCYWLPELGPPYPEVGGIRGDLYLYGYTEAHSPDAQGFGAYIFYFPEPGFDRIVGAFTERFGPAHRVESKNVTTMAGAALTNRVLYWDWPTVKARLFQFGRDIKTSQLWVSTRPYELEFQRREAAKRKEGAKGF